jgi:hypothetical protein
MFTDAIAQRSDLLSFEPLRAAIRRMFKAKPVPATPRPASTAWEAAQLREFASGFIQSDPAFAADLFAAANRHEAASERGGPRR